MPRACTALFYVRNYHFYFFFEPGIRFPLKLFLRRTVVLFGHYGTAGSPIASRSKTKPAIKRSLSLKNILQFKCATQQPMP